MRHQRTRSGCPFLLVFTLAIGAAMLIAFLFAISA